MIQRHRIGHAIPRASNRENDTIGSRTILAASAACLLAAAPAAATTITLNVVNSFARTSAFGLAYDGSNVWWSDNGGVIHEMTTSGVDTGNTINGPYWSALA